MKHRFGYIQVKSQFVPTEVSFQRAIRDYTDILDQMGGQEWSVGKLANPQPLFYLMTTGGTEQALLDLRLKRKELVADEPVLVLAHPAYNSLPASLEVLARLHQDHEGGRIFYLKGPHDSSGFDQIAAAIHDINVSHALKQTRIGLIGTPSDWLVASSPDLEDIQKTWGTRVVKVSMDELKEFIGKVSSDAIPPLREPLLNAARAVIEPSKRDIDEAVKVYLALKESVRKHKLQALTLRCFDLVMGLQTTGCYGLAQLTDEGVIAGCEGDLVSTVAMLWVQLLLNKTPWMANPAKLDEVNNTLWLAHCTIPRGLVKDYGLRSHFESGIGVGIQGTLANEPVTLIRIGGKRMEKLWLAEGDIIQSGKSEDLCRTQAEIRLSTGHVSDLLNAPLGNHLTMVQGHHLKRLHDWWTAMIVGR